MGLLSSKAKHQAPALGLDIGSRTVKAILMDRTGGRLDIRAAGSFQVEEGIVEGGIIMDPPAFGKMLAAHLRTWDISVASAVVSIPSSLAVLRWISVPMLEGEELRNAAKFKAKRHLPFSVDAAYVEASPVEVSSEGGSGNSLVIAVRREVVDSRADAIEHAGLMPVVAELEAQSILRVVERRLNEQSVLWRDASLTIIDVGAVNTHMYVVQNQQLQFIRGIKFGGARFAKALADQLDISLEEAHEYIAQPQTCLTPEGILQMQAGDMPLRVNMQPELEKLTREFLRLLRYFRSLHPERSYAGILDHMILCGGFTSLPGMAEYLESQLELRVERAKPFTGMVGKFDQDSFQSISNRQEAFVVAVGLALAGIGEMDEHQREASGRREFVWARSA